MNVSLTVTILLEHISAENAATDYEDYITRLSSGGNLTDAENISKTNEGIGYVNVDFFIFIFVYSN